MDWYFSYFTGGMGQNQSLLYINYIIDISAEFAIIPIIFGNEFIPPDLILKGCSLQILIPDSSVGRAAGCKQRANEEGVI